MKVPSRQQRRILCRKPAARRRRVVAKRWLAATVVLGLTTASLATLSVTSAAPAAAWDSVPGLSSHDAISQNALIEAAVSNAGDPGFLKWLGTYGAEIYAYAGGIGKFPDPFDPYGELVHRVKRPLVAVGDANDCEARDDLDERTTGRARWAVGSNPGDNHPEYWWQTAVCLWRHGDQVRAAEVLGQLIHSIQDMGSPPHAVYREHGPLSGDQNFEVLSSLTSYDSSYYKNPDSIFYPGKNVLDFGNHRDGEGATFAIPKHGGYSPVLLGSSAADPKPTRLQVTSPKTVQVDVKVTDITKFPIIELQAWYEKADGTIGIATSPHLQLQGLTFTSWTIRDNFAPNGRFWLFSKRDEHGYRTSTGVAQVYVKDVDDVANEVAKPGLHHPWEYYDFLREWTQWAMQSPYWLRYFAGLNQGGSLAFDVTWLTAPNSERALLSMQWRMSQLVTRWVLEDAYRLFNDPTYTPEMAGGTGYKVALYEDHNFNSTGDTPEEIMSYATDCEYYPSSTCGSFVTPSWPSPRPNVGDGIFGACGIGSTVTMKSNDLQTDMLSGRITSVEVRGATLSLFSGKNLTGDHRDITADMADLTDLNFNDIAQSARIVPNGVADVPTARDDFITTPEGAAVTISPQTNDTVANPDTAMVRLHSGTTQHGYISTDGHSITYTPETGPTRSSGPDRFSYDVVYPNGVCDTGTVTVDVGGVNHAPYDVSIDAMLGESPVTTVDEGQAFTLVGSFLDEDLGDTHTAAINWGDGTPVSVVNVAAGSIDFEATHVYADNNQPTQPGYTISAVVADAGLLSASTSTTVTSQNVPPTVTVDQSASGQPFTPVGISVPITAHFTDPGLLDTHTASIDWGDSTTQSLGTVVRSGFAAAHVFVQPGVYSTSVNVTDNDGGLGTATVSLEIVTPADAAGRVADQLRALLTGAGARTRSLLQDAIGQLVSNTPDDSNGAKAKFLAGDLVAGLEKLAKAEADLDQITLPSLTMQKNLITQTAQSVGEKAEADARARLGCIDLTALTCTPTERSSITIIDTYLVAARADFAAGRYLSAIKNFKSATQRAILLVNR